MSKGNGRHVVVGRCYFLYRLCDGVSIFAHISPYISPISFILRCPQLRLSYFVQGDTFLPWGTGYGKRLLPKTVREDHFWRGTLICVTGRSCRRIPLHESRSRQPYALATSINDRQVRIRANHSSVPSKSEHSARALEAAGATPFPLSFQCNN